MSVQEGTVVVLQSKETFFAKIDQQRITRRQRSNYPGQKKSITNEDSTSQNEKKLAVHLHLKHCFLLSVYQVEPKSQLDAIFWFLFLLSNQTVNQGLYIT